MSGTASPDPVVESLRESGLLQADESTLEPTEAFAAAVAEERSALEAGTVASDRLAAFCEVAAVPERFTEIHPGMAAVALAVHRLTDPSEPTDLWDRTFLLARLRDDPPPTEGVPDGFVPTPPSHLPAIADVYQYVIAYVWREECPPCSAVKGRLEALSDERTDRAARIAVYGPAKPEFLLDEYDVGGGPTLLFLRDGAVAVRLVGAATETQIDDCLDVLFE